METARETAESEGLTAESLGDRVARVAEKVVETTTDSTKQAAEEEGLHPQQLQESAAKVADETTAQAKAEAKAAQDEAKSTAARRGDDVRNV